MERQENCKKTRLRELVLIKQGSSEVRDVFKETERQTDRESLRQRVIETERQRDRETERQRD